MEVRYHAYELRPRAKPNARTAAGSRVGALLRVDYPDGNRGFADLHPWPEFGQEPLHRQLGALRTGAFPPLLARSLVLARRDAVARAEGRSLFAGLPPVESHALVTDLRDPGRSAKVLAAAGYQAAKLKIGPFIAPDAVAAWLDGVPLRLRLDANASFTPASLATWLEAVGAHVLDHVEFVEDPAPYEPGDWEAISRRHGLALALDWHPNPLATGLRGVEVLVVKPASQDAEALTAAAVEAGRRVVVTHSMDHPLGRAAALEAAARLRMEHGPSLLAGGLQAGGLYDAEAFARALVEDGPRTLPPAGTGHGFDDLLAALRWDPVPE